MGGFMLYKDRKPYHTLQPKHVLELICKGCINVPTLTEKQIHDKSKGNAISKGLIILQVTWFVMQLVTCVIYHLKITQLEVGTLTFAVLNFLTYAVWWNKPLNWQCPHPVYWKLTESMPEHYIGAAEEEEFTGLQRMWSTFIFPIVELMGDATPRKLRVQTFHCGSIKLEDLDVTILAAAGLLMATIFGSVHCMAWFFAFPTYYEQVLWHTSAIAITSTPCVEPCVLYVEDILEDFDISNWLYVTRIFSSAILIFPIVYITGRGILLVLMFTTLRNLPPDVYQVVSWTALVPHL
ncbi:hypothetical protein BDR06DRAFT_1010126 [Suillus hirtellus]|nr:hypothetical protein BDR06DRAFT_1010126 [Suillus hirtellus]